MADPLSLLSSLAGLTAVGAKLSVDLYQFIDTIRSAPGDIRSLAKELTDLCSIIKRLQTTFNNTSNGSLQHKELSKDFLNVLDSCMEKFLQLQVLLKTHEIKSTDGILARKWKQWSWTLQEKEVTALRAQLEAHKATLNITLLLATHSETTSVKDTTDRIETTVREIMERLMESGDGETTAARYEATSSFILKRYLSSASSTFSSRATSPVQLLRPNLSVVEETPEEEANSDKRPSRRDSKLRAKLNPQGVLDEEKEYERLKMGIVSEDGQKPGYDYQRSPDGYTPHVHAPRPYPKPLTIPQYPPPYEKKPESSQRGYLSPSEIVPPSPSSHHSEGSPRYKIDPNLPIHNPDERSKLFDWLDPPNRGAKSPTSADVALQEKSQASGEYRRKSAPLYRPLELPGSPAESLFANKSDTAINEPPSPQSEPRSAAKFPVIHTPTRDQDGGMYFGQPLKLLMKRDERAVPGPVYNCLCAVFHYGFKTEGIYRFTGTKSHAEMVKQNFDSGKEFDFKDSNSFFGDIHCVSDVLKQFFQELPEPLVTKVLYDEFINAARIDDDLARRKALHEIINRLPDSNYATLRAVALHLHRVQEYSDTNRMTARGLAVEFVEPLMGNITTSGGAYYVLPWKVRAIESIILNAFVIFDVDGIELKTRSFLFGLTGR